MQLTYEQRQAIRRAQDADARERLKHSPRSGRWERELDEKTYCPAKLSYSSIRPGEICGAPAQRGSDYCGIHRRMEELDAIARVDDAA